MRTRPKANPRTSPRSGPNSRLGPDPESAAAACASTARRRSPGSRAATFAALALATASLGACRATRVLAIDSTPPGAEVRVDDVVVGTTPMRLPFKDFGTRRVTLYKPGYLTHSELVVLEPPWYATFPLDLVTEVLLPIGWRHVQPYEATLVAGSGSIASPELQDVLGRAEALRRAGPEGPERKPDANPSVPPPR